MNCTQGPTNSYIFHVFHLKRVRSQCSASRAALYASLNKHIECASSQVLKKISGYIQEQNEKVYAPRGLLLTDPIERGMRVVSFHVPSTGERWRETLLDVLDKTGKCLCVLWVIFHHQMVWGRLSPRWIYFLSLHPRKCRHEYCGDAEMWLVIYVFSSNWERIYFKKM